MIRRAIVMSALVAGLSAAGLSQAWGTVIETQNLVVSDGTGTLSNDQLRSLADQAQAALERILALWSADSRTGRFGKIRVVFEQPRRDTYSSVFFWERKDGQPRRVVQVFGFMETPGMMVHKLTIAVFPQKDKLIRNMMGILTEVQVGNPLSFPMCGFSNDDWVLALLDTRSYIPLDKLGPDHESWGMRLMADGRGKIFDAVKQHDAYAEAGSFGTYLFRKYGVDKLKRLHRLAHVEERPMQEVFGATLQHLEADWLAALKAKEQGEKNNVSILSTVLKTTPLNACAEAQRLALGKR